MRVLSWVVVGSSVAWLLAFAFSPQLSSFSLPEVDSDLVTGTASPEASINLDTDAFARSYTEAWNSRDPSKVAAFYARDGRITINNGDPYEGTEGVTEMARGFYSEFPDIEVEMVRLEEKDQRIVFHWSFTGTHSGTGKPVRIKGSETWRLGHQGLIEESVGWYDAEDYDRQVNGQF